MTTAVKTKKYHIELSQDEVEFLIDLLMFPQEMSETLGNESIRFKFSRNPDKLCDKILDQTHDKYGDWVGDLYAGEPGL